MLKVGILGVGTIAKILVTTLDQKEVETQLVTIWIRIASERKQFLSDFRVVRRWCLNRGRNLNLSAVSKSGVGQAANLRHNMLSTFRGARVVLRLGPREVNHAGECHCQDRLHLRTVEPTTGRRDVKLYPPIDDAARSGTGLRAQIFSHFVISTSQLIAFQSHTTQHTLGFARAADVQALVGDGERRRRILKRAGLLLPI